MSIRLLEGCRDPVAHHHFITEGITNSVEVAASTLYEAAALALAEFRRCGFTLDEPGPANAPYRGRKSAGNVA